MSNQPVFQSPYPRPDLQPPASPVCPRCGSQMTKKVKYTWWGGIVGPSLMNLMKCSGCKCLFNGKTGKPATKAIVIYFVIVWAVALIVGLMLVQSRS